MGTEWVFPFSMPASLMYETLWYKKVSWKISRAKNLLMEQGRVKKPRWTKRGHILKAADLFGKNIVRFVTKSQV